MNNLMNITKQTINNEHINTVNARDLHEFLEVGKDFSNWIKARIEKYNFQENFDYVKAAENTLAQFGELRKPSFQHKIEYYITLDMAKELAMVENNNKGKQARKYFIEVEKQHRAKVNSNQPKLPSNYLEALEHLTAQVKVNLTLNEKLEEAKPKVLFANAVETSKNSILIGELAKLLKQNNIDIGQKRLFDWLRENEYIHKNKNIPTQKSMNLQLFEVKEIVITKPDGSILTYFTPKVTGKGQTYFINKFLHSNNKQLMGVKQ